MKTSYKKNMDKSRGKLLEELAKSYFSIKLNKKSFLHVFGPVKFPMELDKVRYEFNWYIWTQEDYEMKFDCLLEYLKEHSTEQNYNSILTYGDFTGVQLPYVRIHSCCLSGDVFHSTRCDCGEQLNSSLEMIIKNNSGAIVYVARHEGRGIGLFAKALANKIQDYGYDTFEANNLLNFDDDERKYDDVAAILKYFRKEKSVVLLGNNPEKINYIIAKGVKVDSVEELQGFDNKDNANYLHAKIIRAEKMIKFLK